MKTDSLTKQFVRDCRSGHSREWRAVEKQLWPKTDTNAAARHVHSHKYLPDSMDGLHGDVVPQRQQPDINCLL